MKGMNNEENINENENANEEVEIDFIGFEPSEQDLAEELELMGTSF